MWEGLATLPATAPLPEELPDLLYNRLGSLLRCGLYAARLEPFLQHFPRENMMFIDFAGVQSVGISCCPPTQAIAAIATERFAQPRAEFVRSPQQVLDEIYTFVGVSRADYCPLPPGMQVHFDTERCLRASVASERKQVG